MTDNETNDYPVNAGEAEAIQTFKRAIDVARGVARGNDQADLGAVGSGPRPSIVGRHGNLSSFGAFATSSSELRDATIDLQLRQVAPLLLDPLGANFACDRERSPAWGGSEFETAIRDEIYFQLGNGDQCKIVIVDSESDDPNRHLNSDEPDRHQRICQMLRIVDSGFRTVPVPAASRLIQICDVMAYRRAICPRLRQRDGLNLSFSDRVDGVSSADGDEHLHRHQQVARSWRYVSARLAAGLDELGRRLTNGDARALGSPTDINTSEDTQT